jgi:hypothetical protein
MISRCLRAPLRLVWRSRATDERSNGSLIDFGIGSLRRQSTLPRMGSRMKRRTRRQWKARFESSLSPCKCLEFGHGDFGVPRTSRGAPRARRATFFQVAGKACQMPGGRVQLLFQVEKGDPLSLAGLRAARKMHLRPRESSMADGLSGHRRCSQFRAEAATDRLRH